MSLLIGLWRITPTDLTRKLANLIILSYLLSCNAFVYDPKEKKAKQIVHKMILVPSLFGKQNSKQLTRTYKYLHRQPIKT